MGKCIHLKCQYIDKQKDNNCCFHANVQYCKKAITKESEEGCNHESLKPVGGSGKYFKCCECDKLIIPEDQIKKETSFIKNMKSLNPGWDFSRFPLVFKKNVELKDCPFCGGPASYGYSKDGVFVCCSDCQSSSDHLLDNNKTEEEAREVWNIRVSYKYSMTHLFTGFIKTLGNDAELTYETDPRARAVIDLRFQDYLLACKHFDLINNNDNCGYGVNSPTSFQSEDSSKRFFKPK